MSKCYIALIIIAKTSFMMGCCSVQIQSDSNRQHNGRLVCEVSDSQRVQDLKLETLHVNNDSIQQQIISNPRDIITGDWTIISEDTYNEKTKEGWSLMGNSQRIVTFFSDGRGYVCGETFTWCLSDDKLIVKQVNGFPFIGNMKVIEFEYQFKDLGIPVEHIGMILKTKKGDVRRSFVLSKIVNEINGNKNQYE